MDFNQHAALAVPGSTICTVCFFTSMDHARAARCPACNMGRMRPAHPEPGEAVGPVADASAPPNGMTVDEYDRWLRDMRSTHLQETMQQAALMGAIMDMARNVRVTLVDAPAPPAAEAEAAGLTQEELDALPRQTMRLYADVDVYPAGPVDAHAEPPEVGAEAVPPPTSSSPLAEALGPVILRCRATAGAVGRPLRTLPNGVRGPLAAVQPPDGSCMDESSVAQLRGRVVLVDRGGASFVDKVARAQRAGAAGVIVVQKGSVWPFTMADSAGAGTNLGIPAVMIQASDGALVRARLADGEDLLVSVRSEDGDMTCAICLDEFEVETRATRLVCGHCFHDHCAARWLRKDRQCPVCRTKVPRTAATATAPAPMARTGSDDFNAPVPPLGMYT